MHVWESSANNLGWQRRSGVSGSQWIENQRGEGQKVGETPEIRGQVTGMRDQKGIRNRNLDHNTTETPMETQKGAEETRAEMKGMIEGRWDWRRNQLQEEIPGKITIAKGQCWKKVL